MVIVGPVNDPPSIVSIDDQSINEDSVGVFSFEVSDIDTRTVLTLAAYTDTSSVSVSTNSEITRLQLCQMEIGMVKRLLRSFYLISS